MFIKNKEPVLQEQDTTKQACIIPTRDKIRALRQLKIFTKIGQQKQYTPVIIHKLNKFQQRQTKQIKKKSKDNEEYCLKYQKKDRNVASNLIHHLVKYLKSTKQTNQQLIQKIIQNNKLSITYPLFYERLEYLSSQLKTYVAIHLIKQLWFNHEEQMKEFCLIMRIIGRYFYKKTGFSSVYFSNKFTQESKYVHCRGIRILLEMLTKYQVEQFRLNLINS